MGNITFSQEVIDLTKFHVSACKNILLHLPLHFSAPFALCKVCASFSQSAQGSIGKSKCFFYLHLLRRLNCSEKFFTFLFHMDIVDVWSWQILTFLHIKVMASVAPARPAHCSGCLNVLWRIAGPCSLGLQSWWRARRNHTTEQLPLPLSYHSNLFGASRETTNTAKAKKNEFIYWA